MPSIGGVIVLEHSQADARAASRSRLLRHATLKEWTYIPLVLVALGLGSIGMLLGASWIRDTMIAHRVAQVEAAGEIRVGTAVIHLWMEELIAGDAAAGDVHLRIDRHLEHIESLLDSIGNNETIGGARGLVAPSDPSILKQINFAGNHLARFSRLSRERRDAFDAGRDVGARSQVDLEYDQEFEHLLLGFGILEDMLRARLKRSVERERSMLRIIIAAWVAIVALAVAGIWNREYRRRQTEIALRDNEALLLQAQKMDAIGRLAGGMAHDINNHLAAITMQCEAVKREVGHRVEVARRLDAIVSTTTKSSALIRRLLAFSRQQPIRPEIVDINRVLEDLKGMLRALLEEDVDLQMKLTPDLKAVLIDAPQFEQVVVNLAVNAREAMPAGGRLTIETANHCEDGKAWVRLSVTDSGGGIDPAIRDRIFEPFFTTKDRASSSGLGLATIDGIIRQNGGRIGLTSVLDQGTTFKILLPVSQGAVAQRRIENPSQAVEESDGRLSILLVEDNHELRNATGLVLASLGHKVQVAANADEALERFAALAGAIDVLITDVVLPQIKGPDLARRLRASRPGLQVMFISSFAEDVDLAGADLDDALLLQKPFDLPQLADRLSRLVSQRVTTRHCDEDRAVLAG